MSKYDTDYLAICKELADELNKNDNPKKIEELKYKALTYGYSLLDVVINYQALYKWNIKFDFGFKVIKKGTILYRIREYKEGVDFLNPQEWTAPPNRPQNRANRQGQEALYLGSKETTCILETNLMFNQKYVLAEYECLEDIKLGSFCIFSPNNVFHNLAGITLNAFLIAPARNEKNKELLELLDNEYKEVSIDNLVDWKNNFDLPYRFAVLNKRNQYYKLTNKICDILREQYKDGIEYSSCYIPVETLGIDCSDYNVVLYDQGIKKIKFNKCEIKVNKAKFTNIDIARLCIETAKKARKNKNDKT